jgi:protocatechuate 3,4-dioxygenase, alpha subunit
MDLIPCPSQTIGPFFHLTLAGFYSISIIARPNTVGERIRLICTVYDGEAAPIRDAMLEIWQANAQGKYNHPDDFQEKPIEQGFRGFGHLASDGNGICMFETIKPGRVPSWTDVPQAPHLVVSVFARGVLKRLPTRVYFAGDPANQEDPVLALVPAERRDTLMARPDPGQPGVWHFDIHLCGEKETVFFDV